MICPKCKSHTKVLETRDKKNHQRRRRECLMCHHRFITLEILEDNKEKKPNQVLKEIRTDLKSLISRWKQEYGNV